MFRRLYPKEHHCSVFDINYDELWSRGIRNIIFDIDNTLVAYNVSSPTEEICGLFKSLREKGFSFCILSNNREKRVKLFCESLSAAYVPKAGKPGIKGALRALKLTASTPQETVIIGDQIFTDVWCGNRLGIYTILVEPVSRENDELITRVKRGAEAFIMRRF